MRRLPLLTVLTLGALAAAGCSGDADRAKDDSTPSPSSTESFASAPPSTPGVPQATAKGTPSGTSQAAKYCESLLTKDDVSTLAGVPMGKVSVQAVGSTPGCLWTALDDSRITIQVVNASSSTWAEQIQLVARSVKDAGATFTPELTQQLKEAQAYVKRGQEVDADLACEIFSALATVSGSDPGVDATLRITPNEKDATTISAQVCNSDEYSFLQLNDPALASDLAAKVTAMRAGLQQVQGSPLTF